MPIVLNDKEIAARLVEPKVLPADYPAKFALKPKRGHKERELDIAAPDNSQFRLILRQSDLNHLDFSVILAWLPPNTSQIFRLRRYNGKSHEHTNTLERKTFYGFHIHMATERYQLQSGMDEDAYAEPTDRYADFQGALGCIVKDCNLVLPPGSQMNLLGA